jgi:putative Mg2+ transporter-C (MgtC) family protein
VQSLQFAISNQDLIKIGLAVVCGGLLGVERQYKNKTAGFRTIIVICLGATIFTAIAQRFGGIGSMNIVTGVGFIGGGVIFKDNIAVSGLTTAAVIWVSAAIGMAVGSGNYTLGLVSTVLTLMVLMVFNVLERYIDKVHKDKLFLIEFANADYENLNHLRYIIAAHKLKSETVQITKKDGCLHTAIWVTGHRKNIVKLDEELLRMEEVRSF